ncbi:MAG: hypothetical protein KDD62_16480 [Bdellovibrionales bacterium]|nr:hypothetical protein [Bdellovibrionales bacterium]
MLLKITKRRLWAVVGSAFINIAVLASIASARLGYGYVVGEYTVQRYCQMLVEYYDWMRWANSGGNHSGSLPPRTPLYESIIEIVYLSSLFNVIFLFGLAILFVLLAGSRVIGVRRFAALMPLSWMLVCLMTAFFSYVFLFSPIREVAFEFAGKSVVTWGQCEL